MNKDVIEAAKNIVMMDLALLQAEAAAGMYKKPIEAIAKEFRYDPLPPEVRMVVIAAWTRGGMLPRATVEEMVPLALQSNLRSRGETMALTFTDVSANTLSGTNYQARGSNGETIVVEASQEVIRDHGEAAVQQKAREKYDAGKLTGNKVTVRTDDFA